MITLSNISSFRDSVKDILTMCDELLENRTYEKLWHGSLDYENAKIAQKLLPDEYYKVRIFDKFMNLRYHNRFKCYYIYFENCYPSLTFRKYFPETKNSPQSYNNTAHYFLYTDFDTSVSTFILAVNDIFNQIKKSPDLLYDLDDSPDIQHTVLENKF